MVTLDLSVYMFYVCMYVCMYVSTYVCVCVCVLLGMSVIDRCLTVARSDVACKVFARSSPSLHLRCLLGMV